MSDGLLQDLSHIARASGVGVALNADTIPVATAATLEQALGGGDDYALCFTTASAELAEAHSVIGVVAGESGITLDGAPVTVRGYNHFS